MDELRIKAKEARKRLRQGFWNDIIKERQAIIQNALEHGQDLTMVKEYCRRKIEERIRNKDNSNKISEEDILYEKVCQLMESNEVLLNPLSRLIDHKVYDEMSDNAKQVYILKLSEQYIKMKERYNNEHSHGLDIAYWLKFNICTLKCFASNFICDIINSWKNMI